MSLQGLIKAGSDSFQRGRSKPRHRPKSFERFDSVMARLAADSFENLVVFIAGVTSKQSVHFDSFHRGVSSL